MSQPLLIMSKPSTDYVYTIALQTPPGFVVAPNGFPADPYPMNAPQTFLDARDIRITVFCEEQHCSAENELDEDDPRSYSWVMYQRSPDSDRSGPGEPVSMVRMVPPPHAMHPNGYVNPDEEPYVKMTRVATVKHARGRGLSPKVIAEAMKWMAEHAEEIGNGWKGLVLAHSQVTVEPVYARMGFVTDDKLGRWVEEGISHLGMWKQLDINRE